MSSFSSAFMPGHRLVEEQELRLERERARQLDPLLQAVGERAHHLLADVLDLEEVDDVLDDLAVRDLLALRPARSRRAPARTPVRWWTWRPMRRLSRTVMPAEERDVLEGAGDAERGPRRRARARDVAAPSKRMRAALRPVDAGDAVEEARLPGAVRADDRRGSSPASTARLTSESAVTPRKLRSDPGRLEQRHRTLAPGCAPNGRKERLAAQGPRRKFCAARHPGRGGPPGGYSRDGYPGGQPNARPPSTCRWTWKTSWCASRFTFTVARQPALGDPALLRERGRRRGGACPTSASSSGREVVQRRRRACAGRRAGAPAPGG